MQDGFLVVHLKKVPNITVTYLPGTEESPTWVPTVSRKNFAQTMQDDGDSYLSRTFPKKVGTGRYRNLPTYFIGR